MNQKHEIILGEREEWGGRLPFGISPADRRQHVYVIGKTGTGKTTLLRNMLVQDMNLGHGVGVIDPHGDLAEELLNQVPPWRSHHVVYFNPSDLDFPFSMNLLAGRAPRERPLVASGVVAAFRNIWRDSWGPRMEYILYNAICALLDCQNVSLLGVNRMLTDERYRAWIIRQINDPFVRTFWKDEYAAYNARFRTEAIAPIQNKLGQFLLNPSIRHILGQIKCKVEFRFIVDHERIFIANLSKGKIGDDKANLLGSLLVTQFQLAAMRRADQPEDDRRDYYLFIDEFFNFTTDAFASLLAEARKYRLSLTIAHQYLDQLSLAVRQAVLGNVGTSVVFRVGYSDAEIFEKELGKSVSASSLASLDRFEAAINLLDKGSNCTPFIATTQSPLENRFNRAARIINRSRCQFSIAKPLIEEKLARFMGFGGGPHHSRRGTLAILENTTNRN